MMNPNDEGQEVHLITSGISFTAPKRAINIEGFKRWVTSLASEMPQLIEEEQVAQAMGEISAAFVERYLDSKEESAIPGYRIVDSKVITKLSMGSLTFDLKTEVVPQVQYTINMVGFCPVLILYHIDDYISYINSEPISSTIEPYLGRIKIITFNELFY